VQFSGRQLALEHWPLPAPLSQGRLRGSVTVDGDLRGNFTDPFSLQGTLTLAITDGAISAGVLGGFPLPAVQSVQTHLRAVLVPGRLEIAELKLNTDGIDTTLKGTITLRTPFARSELALQLTTKTTGSPPPALNALISFLPAVPGMPGEHRALLTGTLVTPVIR
jgi:type II secretion system protein N